jgi:hypothetical protein
MLELLRMMNHATGLAFSCFVEESPGGYTAYVHRFPAGDDVPIYRMPDLGGVLEYAETLKDVAQEQQYIELQHPQWPELKIVGHETIQ